MGYTTGNLNPTGHSLTQISLRSTMQPMTSYSTDDQCMTSLTSTAMLIRIG